MMPLGLVWTAGLATTVQASSYAAYSTIRHAAFRMANKITYKINDRRILGTSVTKVAFVPG